MQRYEEISQQQGSNEHHLHNYQCQEERNKSLIVELSNVVKQQKVRIDELNKSKCDVVCQYKEIQKVVEEKNEDIKNRCVFYFITINEK